MLTFQTSIRTDVDSLTSDRMLIQYFIHISGSVAERHMPEAAAREWSFITEMC